MTDLSSEILLEHGKNPRNFGELKEYTAKAHDVNTSCGDKIIITVLVEDDKVKDVNFSGEGCLISQASASLLTEHIKGMKIDDVIKMEREDILKIIRVPISMIRLKCAMLSIKVIKLALYKTKGIDIHGDN